MVTLEEGYLPETLRTPEALLEWSEEFLVEPPQTLYAVKPGARPSGIGLRHRHEKVGLVVFGSFQKRDTLLLGSISTLRVVPEHRGRGLGTWLLRHSEERLAERGHQYLEIRFKTGEEPFQRVCEFLMRNGWRAPMQYGVEYVARVRDFLKLPWLKKAGASRGFSIRRWDSLDRSAKERLEHEMGPQSWRREGIGPNSWRHPVHEISLALVAPDEKIAGWLLTHLQGEDTLCYDSFYVRPQYRHLGVSLFMLVSAVRLQQEAGIELGCWLVNSHRRNTKRLYDTKLRQAIEARAEVWISSRYGGEVALD